MKSRSPPLLPLFFDASAKEERSFFMRKRNENQQLSGYKTLLVQGQRVPVSDEVYQVYYQERERARYLAKQAREKESSREALLAMGVQVDYQAGGAPSAEGECFAQWERTDLAKALEKLGPERADRLLALVLGESTERALAEELGLSRSAIHKRKLKALAELRQALS